MMLANTAKIRLIIRSIIQSILQRSSTLSSIHLPLEKLTQYCIKNYRCLTQNPGLFFARKIGRFEMIRDGVYHFAKIAGTPSVISPAESSTFQDVDVDAVVEAIRTQGYSLGLNLSEGVQKEILEYAYSTPCYGDRNYQLEFFYSERENLETQLGRQLKVGSYMHQTASVVAKLTQDPVMMAIATQFLGSTPVCIASELL
jgi:hypothetical protein